MEKERCNLILSWLGIMRKYLHKSWGNMCDNVEMK